MTQNDVQLICFDLGRVLIQLNATWDRACAAAGVVLPESAKAAERTDEIFALVQQNEVGQLDGRAFAQAASDLVGLSPTDTLRAFCAWLDRPYDGVERLVGRLKSMDVRTACLSNTNDLHWELMTTPGGPQFLPLDELDYRFASHLVGHRKPDAAIYAHVEQATGTQANAIVFFDDNEENVAAARGRGWQAWQILPQISPIQQIIAKLREYGLVLPDEG